MTIARRDDEVAARLVRLLRLRHAIRNLYAWTIERDDLDVHVAALAETHGRPAADLDAFAPFLAALARE